MEFKVTTYNEEDTIELAQNFESEKFPNMIICLNGELGSGKTVFRIAMDYDHGRFYDRKRTMAEFYNQDFEPVSKKRKTVKKEGVKI